MSDELVTTDTPLNVSADISGAVQWDAPADELNLLGYLVQHAVGIGEGYTTLPSPVKPGDRSARVQIDEGERNYIRVGAFYSDSRVPIWSEPVVVDARTGPGSTRLYTRKQLRRKLRRAKIAGDDKAVNKWRIELRAARGQR